MKKILFILTLSMTMIACTKTDNNEIRQQAALDVINTRVSVRQFTGEKLTQEQITTILKAGMSAPTAVNRQPWAFVVVDDETTLAQLALAVTSSRIENNASHAIIVCGDMHKALEGEAQGYWVEDTSAATENMLLAAHAMGLGSLWVGVYPMKERVEAVGRIIGVPEHIVPMCIITLGYPAEQPAVKDKYLEENIHYNKW